jgi:hypothetical protein
MVYLFFHRTFPTEERMSPEFIQRVKQFLDSSKGKTLEQFLYMHPLPVLVVLGGITKSNDGFVTRSVTSVEVFDFHNKTDDLDPNARVFPLEKRENSNHYSQMIIIGRTPNSDIPLISSEISKMHSYLTWKDTDEGKTYKVVDGNSRNGTWLNEKKLAPHKPCDIKSGQVISLGGSIFLCFFSPKDFFSALSRMNVN